MSTVLSIRPATPNDHTQDQNEISAIRAVTNNGLELQHVMFQQNRNIVMKDVQNNGLALQYAAAALTFDREIVLEAVKNNGLALQYAACSVDSLDCFRIEMILNDLEIASAAVKQNGLALKYVSPKLKNNYDIVKTAIEQNGLALQYASPALQTNKEFVNILKLQCKKSTNKEFKKHANAILNSIEGRNKTKKCTIQ